MIKDVVGDFTDPVVKTGTRIMCHCVNDIGCWGSGVVLAISSKWNGPEKQYKKWAETDSYSYKNLRIPFKQGQCQLVKVDNDMYVANLVAQSNIGYYHGSPAVRNGALEESLLRLKYEFLPSFKDVTLHFPYICCGRAGGDINKVREILERVFPETDMYLYEYDGEFK